MSPTSPECTAIILSGGRSVRFGQDKGRAQWRGRSLLQHVLDGFHVASSCRSHKELGKRARARRAPPLLRSLLCTTAPFAPFALLRHLRCERAA